jgi:peptidoglycan hydrolase-like protein with peptidoglycan-binding domain
MAGSVVVDNEEEKARKQLIARLQTRPLDKRFAQVASSTAVNNNIPQASKPENNILGKLPAIVPLKPSGKEKLWTRAGVFGVILALLAGVVTFWYWWFVIKTQPPPTTIECTETSDCATGEICKDAKCIKSAPKCTTNNDCVSGQTCDSSGNCVASGSTVEAPPPLFGVDVSLTREANISSTEEIKSLLSQWVEEDQEKNTFRRLLIKTNENKYVSLKDIFNALEVRVPANFYSNFGDNYTLFSYSQIEGNRLGIVVEVSQPQDLSSAMRAEESSMKEDFSPLLNIIYVGSPAKIQQFRDAISLPGYKGPNFRYLATSTKDVGLCYIVSQDRFIFTTSLTSIEKLIERMAIEMPVIELAKDLDSKSTGDDVKLLQTWLASDASIYTGKISGIYDAATKEAVKKFQNKYASEILAPQGIYEGTGNVDERTRMKLNELYAKSGIRPRGTELINDLRFGSNGDEVRLLQTWLAKDSTIYPEGMVTGWFGSLTERAVKKFQEKFDKEILIPNGLSKGTGVVDKATRAKLNSLYKK